MTTLAARVATSQHATGAYDRVFYTGMAGLMGLTVLVGFGPTYYFRGYAATHTISGAPFSSLHHLHGLVFTAWVLLFIVQTGLVAAHRVALHRRLGIAGIGLAIAMVAVGVTTAITSAARGAAPAGVDPLAFLAVPLFDMVLFAGFIGAATRMRRNKEAHKRLMLLAYISIITAAVARLPGVLPLGPLAFFGLSFVFALLGVAYDGISRGRVHPAYVWGGMVLVLFVPLRLAISGTQVWRSFAEFLVR